MCLLYHKTWQKSSDILKPSITSIFRGHENRHDETRDEIRDGIRHESKERQSIRDNKDKNKYYR